MQQEPAPPRSPAPGQDPAPSGAPSMPPPEPASEGHQPSPSRSPAEQALEEEFQFLCCQSCQAEAKCPKLLPCLHTLCSGCLEASGLRCSICQVPGPLGAGSPALDNVFFESLQRRLSVYRQIVDAQAVCTRCKEPADFWCFECEQLLCAKCFEAHQWFLKHEARPLAELRSQSVCEFLDSTRKSNSIFCSNPNHRTPMLTSIYCRGCSKPLCCSCALLDSSHGELKCDISAEIQQRQEELDTMARVLQEQDGAFGAAHAQMHSAVSQLGRARADTEALIHARVRQLVEHVLAREQELLAGVTARYQRCYEELAGRMGRLEAVLQRIRTGSALVRRMKLYASDQEVLDMHGFLRDALHRLRQEEPHDLHTAVRTDGFEEFKVRLQELVSCITRGTDLAVPRRASPDAAGTPRDSLDVDQTPPPEEMLGSPAQAPQLTETHTGALVQSVPGVHPVPVHAYSIRDPSCREEVCNKVTPQKRKSCQTECPRKAIKMESEEERETRLAQSSPEQPRPSTSKAVSPPLDGPSSPESPIMGNEVFLPNSNHSTGDPGEAAATRGERGHPRFARGGSEDGYKLLRDVLGFQCEEARGSVAPSPDTHKGASVEERVVVISSSEDSDAENSSSRELDDSSSESSDLQLEGPSSLRVLDNSLADPQAEDRPLVFFDLKIDSETQKISQLAAVNRESEFRVLIQPQAYSSMFSKAVSLEVGLQHFLGFLGSMRRPVLACSKLWGPSLPIFFRALEDMNRLWGFQEAISGFLAVLPLVRERVPQASSFRLRSLAKTYLARNVNERSALATVLALRDLCRLLEISPGPWLAQHVYSFSSLQCFASLQPLVQAAALAQAQARLLALHNVSFTELLAAHRRDPQQGLKKYSRYLGPQTSTSPPSQRAVSLQALSTYFKGRSEGAVSAPAQGLSTLLTGHSFAKRACQQS
ncbi:protein PML isoform X1 [Canis lupus dingo]|uniref:Protein PML n=1 Tax=Canis lupus familiaris TaxID=9615 RepID=A0A8I3Q588_CANLF|nr:protein PML isoform X1 [Canis lupus dingo]XP_038298826.1 protein PML isoform X1 [Canis lupus familiaris]